MKICGRLGRIVVLCVMVAFTTGCVVVEDGTIGVSKSFGNIDDSPLVPGVHANVPLVREVEVWNVKTQRLSRKRTASRQTAGSNDRIFGRRQQKRRHAIVELQDSSHGSVFVTR